MATTKSKTTKKAPAKKKATKAPAKSHRSFHGRGTSGSAKKAVERVLETHPFEPGAKVTVHWAHNVEIEQREGREPSLEPVAKATVGKKGELKVKLEPGSYAVAGKVERPRFGKPQDPAPKPVTGWEYISFTVG